MVIRFEPNRMRGLVLNAILIALSYCKLVSGCVNNFDGKVLRAAGDWVIEDFFILKYGNIGSLFTVYYL